MRWYLPKRYCAISILYCSYLLPNWSYRIVKYFIFTWFSRTYVSHTRFVVTSGLVYLVLKLSGYLMLFPLNGSGLASLLLVQKWYWIHSATQFRWQECIICDSMCAPIICFLVRIITRWCGSTIWFKGQTIIFEHGYPHEAIWAKTYYWAAFSSMFFSV